MAKITISEGIGYLKTLTERHSELIGLRNENSAKETRYFGADANKSRDIVPVYDVRKLDGLVSKVAMEIRKLDMAIKTANATTELAYEWSEDVLGQIE